MLLNILFYRGRKAVEDMADYVSSEEKRQKAVIENYEANNRLLINLQSGITTLLEKLKDVKLKPVS